MGSESLLGTETFIADLAFGAFGVFSFDVDVQHPQSRETSSTDGANYSFRLVFHSVAPKLFCGTFDYYFANFAKIYGFLCCNHIW